MLPGRGNVRAEISPPSKIVPSNSWHRLRSDSRTTSTTAVTSQEISNVKNASRGSEMPARNVERLPVRRHF